MRNSKLSIAISQSDNPDFYRKQYNLALSEIKKLKLRTNCLGLYFREFIKYDAVDDLVNRSVKLRQLGYRNTLERKILQYGEEIGRKLWNEYCNIQAITNSKEYKSKHHGMNEADFVEYNKSRASSLQNFIKRYGEDLGNSKWDTYCKRQSYAGCAKGYFIEKYGEVKGTEEWNRINSLKGRTLKKYIRQYGEVDGNVRYLQYMELNNKRFSLGSAISQRIFWQLFDYLTIDERNHCYFMEHNGEFGKYCSLTRTYKYYDFVVTNLKLCIEFNGDVFHANPEKFESTDTPNFYAKGKTAAEIWKSDKLKQGLIESAGYKVVNAWESSYNIDLLISEINDARARVKLDS